MLSFYKPRVATTSHVGAALGASLLGRGAEMVKCCEFLPTASTSGPWDPRLQHGGPPTALLARAIELAGVERGYSFVSHVSALMMKPVRMVPLRVEVTPVREGAKAAYYQAVLKEIDSGVETFSVTACCLKGKPVDRVPAPPPDVIPPTPSFEQSEPFVFGPHVFNREECYGKSFEFRLAAGASGSGPTQVWARQLVQLVEGEDPTPLQRLLCLADSAGGLSFYVDFADFTFVNPTLTLDVLRHSPDEWIAISAKTVLNPDSGCGVVSGDLFDRRGFIARSAQSQLLEQRSLQTGAKSAAAHPA